MAGVFGKSQTGPVSAENPLGLNRKQAPEGAGNPGQPVQQQPAGNGNVGQAQQQQQRQVEPQGAQHQQQNQQPQGQQQPQQPQQPQEPQQQPQSNQQEPQQGEGQIEDIDVNDDYERKIAFLRKKFDGPEDFEESAEELAGKLGVDIPQEFNSQEELINFYIDLEKRKGQLGQQNNQNRQNDIRQQMEQIRRENQQLRQNLQQLYLQQNQQQPQKNQPQRDPNTGQFINQQQQQQNNQQVEAPTADEIIENIDLGLDPDESLSDLYDKGFESEHFKKAVAKTADEIVKRRLEAQQQEQQQEQQKQQQLQQQARQREQIFRQQAEQIKQQYGEQEFEQHKQDMMQEFQKYPMYLDPNLFPNGFQMVYEKVRSRNNNYQQQQNVMQNQNQNNNAQKKAARMPGSQGNARFKINQQNQNLNPEQRIKQQIFNAPDNKQGVFG